jgi:hypothetical protein
VAQGRVLQPGLEGGRGGYYRFATQSNATPGNGSGPNQVNSIDSDGRMTVTQEPFIDPEQNYLTNVGAMSGSGSFYGTFDQNGNVWELIDSGGKLGGNTLLREERGPRSRRICPPTTG